MSMFVLRMSEQYATAWLKEVKQPPLCCDTCICSREGTDPQADPHGHMG